MIKRTFLLATFLVVSLPAMAQLELGASYEIRDESPKNGFGLRAEAQILKMIPIVKLGLRGHFSYFSEENSIDNGISYSRDLTNYDFGLAVTGGIPLGLLEPYVGLGLGSENVDVRHKILDGSISLPDDEDYSGLYWNTFVGAKVTVLPFLKPFVEYRFSGNNLEVPDLSDKTSRVIFGVVLSF